MNKQNTQKKISQTSASPTRSNQSPRAYTSYAQTYPKARPIISTQLCTDYSAKHESGAGSDFYNEEQSDDEEYKNTLPVYAQVRKSHSDALRRKSIKTVSGNLKIHSRESSKLSDPHSSPVNMDSRHRHILTNSDRDNANISDKQFRPKRLTFN